MTGSRRTLIVGAAGREFHAFNTVYRQDVHHLVLGFTAAEYCVDDSGTYPPSLAGPLYPDGLPIFSEESLDDLIRAFEVKDVVYAYPESPLSEVVRIASRVLAAGADFQVLNPERLMLPTRKPVIAVTAARAAAGKSPTARYITDLLLADGYRVAVVRPPRLPRPSDHRDHSLTDDRIVVREDAEPLAADGVAVFSGLDYAAVVAAAEAEADVLVWDGDGNDPPYLRPTLHLVLVDPLRAGHELEYFPGELGLRLADAVVVTKCDAATVAQIDQVIDAIERINPAAQVLTADSPVQVDGGEKLRGQTVAIVEESSSLRLEAIRPGAGMTAARQSGVSGIISPKPYAVGSLARFYRRNPAATQVLPVLGDTHEELAELEATLAAVPSEAIINATRLDLSWLLPAKPVAWASYSLRPHDPEALAALVRAAARPG